MTSFFHRALALALVLAPLTGSAGLQAFPRGLIRSSDVSQTYWVDQYGVRHSVADTAMIPIYFPDDVVKEVAWEEWIRIPKGGPITPATPPAYYDGYTLQITTEATELLRTINTETTTSFATIAAPILETQTVTTERPIAAPIVETRTVTTEAPIPAPLVETRTVTTEAPVVTESTVVHTEAAPRLGSSLILGTPVDGRTVPVHDGAVKIETRTQSAPAPNFEALR